MKRPLLPLPALSVALLAALNLARAAEGGGDWKPLFNGRDLTGWVPVHEVTFQVKEGNLHLVTGMGWLRTEKEYGDFILEFECRALEEKFDSGLFFRAGTEGKPWPDEGWQMNLRFDAVGGLVYKRQQVQPAPLGRVPVNRWIKFKLEVKGKKAVLEVDGEEGWTAETIDRPRGYIGIQAENKAFEFRNLRVRELGG